MIRFIKGALLLLIGVTILSCASSPTVEGEKVVSVGETFNSSQGIEAPDRRDDENRVVPRYLAWLQGSAKTGYQVNKKEVLDKIRSLEKKGVSPENKDEYLEYVSLLDAAGQYKKAGEKVRDYILKSPKDGRGAFLLGVNYLRLKKRAMAKHLFEKLEKDESLAWRSLVLNNLGMMALEDGMRYVAIDYFQKASKAKPAIAAPLVNLGSLYLESYSYADAERAFYLGSELEPDFEDAVLGRGVALESLGRFKEAHEAYAGFLSRRPKALAVLYNDSIILGKRLNQNSLAVQQLLRYVQEGGKETAKAQELIQSWR